MTFDEELRALVKQAQLDGVPHEELEAAVAQLCHKHGREVPPPITGTVSITEPDDGFR